MANLVAVITTDPRPNSKTFSGVPGLWHYARLYRDAGQWVLACDAFKIEAHAPENAPLQKRVADQHRTLRADGAAQMLEQMQHAVPAAVWRQLTDYLSSPHPIGASS